MKVRQPLARALASGPGFAELPPNLLAEIAAELNVGSVVAIDAAGDSLVDTTAKANFRTLGRRFGKAVQQVAAAIAAADAAALRDAFRETGTATIVDDGWLDLRAILFSEERSLRAGRHYRESWNSAPYGPSFPAAGITRQGDRVLVDLPLHSDAEGHAGGSVADTSRTALYRNGALVGEELAPGYGEFDVPPGAADYRLETSSKRSFTDLSTEVSATWTFRSRHVAGDDPAALPASAIRFAPRLDRGNAAPAGRSFVIPVTVQRQPGAPSARVAALTVDVSYDGGKTWRKAGVRAAGKGWVATVQHPAGAGHVSLRATARDTAGNTVTQRVIQAYRLR